MKRLVGPSLATLLSLAIALIAAGPARADTLQAPTATQVTVTLTEMALTLDKATVPAGAVVFNIANKGVIEHELVVLKTDIADGVLPASVSEAGKIAEVGHVTEIDPVPVGTTITLAANLTAGNYVLVCDKPGHYAAGMHVAFTVAEPVNIALKEMSVTPDRTFWRAGAVTFNISNLGTVSHELVVIKTGVPDGGLAPDPASPGQIIETGSQGEADDIAAGSAATLTLTLAPGSYALICDQPGHYAAGMHVPFTVLPTLSRSASAAQDASLAALGYEDLSSIQQRLNTTTLLASSGVKASALDLAAIAAGLSPRGIGFGGSLIY